MGQNKKTKNPLIANSSQLTASKGFTLVELLVSMTIFVIVVSIAATIFIRALRSERTAVALVAVNDNSSLMLEQMAREIRAGKDFSVSTASDGLSFTTGHGEDVSYFLENEAVKKRTGTETVALTASNVAVKKLYFFLLPSPDADGVSYRPRITISLAISAKTGDFAATPTVIQTTVSARALNN